jgi:hypothetical protein
LRKIPPLAVEKSWICQQSFCDKIFGREIDPDFATKQTLSQNLGLS